MENTTPEYAKIEVIRKLQLIPEKMYRKKLLLLFIFDSIMIFFCCIGLIFMSLKGYPNSYNFQGAA